MNKISHSITIVKEHKILSFLKMASYIYVVESEDMINDGVFPRYFTNLIKAVIHANIKGTEQCVATWISRINTTNIDPNNGSDSERVMNDFDYEEFLTNNNEVYVRGEYEDD